VTAPAPVPTLFESPAGSEGILDQDLASAILEVTELDDQRTSVVSNGTQTRASATQVNGGSFAADLASARELFNDLTAVHVAHVRNVMLELRRSEVSPSLVESSLPALRSLRGMAGQMGLDELCTALDEFCGEVKSVVDGSPARANDLSKDRLLQRYTRLIELIPQAFDLDAEYDRREPIIVEGLLLQVDGVEKLTVEKLFAVGLSRLDALLAASAEEMAAVAGIRREIAECIVARLRVYRLNAAATIAAADLSSALGELGELMRLLSEHHRDYERAAIGWTEDCRQRKQRSRKEREQTYQKVRVVLARLGERDRIDRLERLSFQERILDVDAYIEQALRAQSALAAAAPRKRDVSRESTQP
jgi:hypothetical protein